MIVVHILNKFNNEIICVSAAEEGELFVLAESCCLCTPLLVWVKHEGSLSEILKHWSISIPVECQDFRQELKRQLGTFLSLF